MWVVKIGGSLLSSIQLRGWLEALACYGTGNVTVVPGGGAFADQVRSAQQKWGYDDAAAHHMALLAMEQFGVMMTAMRPELSVARSFDEIQSTIDAGRVPVWLPTEMVLADRQLPANWDLTSDSLAVWLAQALGACRLLLVKSRGLEGILCDCEAAMREGIVDPLFGAFLHRGAIETWICGPDAHSELRTALYTETGFGARVIDSRARAMTSRNKGIPNVDLVARSSTGGA